MSRPTTAPLAVPSARVDLHRNPWPPGRSPACAARSGNAARMNARRHARAGAASPGRHARAAAASRPTVAALQVAVASRTGSAGCPVHASGRARSGRARCPVRCMHRRCPGAARSRSQGPPTCPWTASRRTRPGCGGGAGACAVLRKQACAAPERRGRSTSRRQPPYTCPAPRRARASRSVCNACNRRARMRAARKHLVSCVFSNAPRRVRVQRRALPGRPVVASRGNAGPTGRMPARKTRAEVLTVEKTVIRFRSNSRCRRRE